MQAQGHTQNPCPRCPASRASLEAKCDACGWHPAPARSPPLEQVAVSAKMLIRAASTISIASLVLVTALVAVCVSVIVLHPVTGVILSCISSVALLRAALFITYSKADGIQLGVQEKIVAFVQSALLVVALEAAAAIAFVTVCLKVTQSANSISTGLFAGGIIALLLTILILTYTPVYRKE